MGFLGERSQKAMEKDVPDYRAVPLRRPFLILLFLFVCGLTVLLECLLRNLPNEHDRNKIPQEFPHVPVLKRHGRQHHISVSDSYTPAKRQRRGDLYPSATPALQPQAPSHGGMAGKSTTPFVTIKPHAQAVPNVRAINIPVPRPPSSQYANTKRIETYITWANSWYGNPENPYARTPLFPGQDSGDKCVYYYQGIVITANSSGCRAIFGWNQESPPGPGWKRATWVDDEIWFPPGESCDEDYDGWYSGYPSNQSVSQLAEAYSWVDPEVSWVGMWWDDVLRLIQTCTWHDGRRDGVAASTGPGPADPVPVATTVGSVLLVYAACFPRMPGGKIIWPASATGAITQANQLYIEDVWPAYQAVIGRQIFIPELSIHSTLPTVSATATATDQMTSRQTLETSTGRNLASEPEESSTITESVNLSPTATSSQSLANSSRTPWITRSSTLALPLPKPGSTVTYIEIPVTHQFETITKFTSNGTLIDSTITSRITSTMLAQIPAVMAPASVITLNDTQGRPTTTSTNYGGNLVLATILTTLTNSLGSPTATSWTKAPATSIVKTLTNAQGMPTATVTSFPVFPQIPGAKPADIVLAKRVDYFVVYFFPVLLTALLLIPVQILDAEIKLLLPYRLLTRPQGSAHALGMRTGGLAGRVSGLRLLWRYGDPISVLSDLMLISAACLVAVSGETVGLKLRGSCIRQNLSTCLVTVAAFPGPARAAEALLGMLMVLILGLGVVLSRSRTGIAAHPSSVAAVCALMQVPETVDVLREMEVGSAGGEKGDLNRRLGERLEDIEFRLWRVENGPRAENYGLVVVRGRRPLKASSGWRRQGTWSFKSRDARKMGLHVTVSERVLQGIFLFILCGLLTVVLYYENTEYANPLDSPFEWFMDSQEFGVTMLFTGLGELVSFIWDHLCDDFNERAIFLRMAQRPQPAALSVLEPRARNVFTSLWRALRRGDPLAGTIAFAGVLSKFLPALLSGVPFASAQTWKTHEICTWTTIALLVLMIVVLIGHMWRVKWPYMPANPDSLAGLVYYVCDSSMLKDFERLSMLGRRERDRRVERMGRMYRFGWMTGESGQRRIGINYAEGEQGFKMHSLGPLGFGIPGKMRSK